MKSFFKYILKHYLRIVTRIVVFIHRPTVIAVAGSTNKNFVKKEIKRRLEEMEFTVRANPKNFNTEIGLPLSILSLPSGYNEYKKWMPAILLAPLKIFQRNFPQFLVLSLGTSDEGDMKYLLSVVKPDISVITEITQKYKEGYSDIDRLVEEYQLLAKKTKKGGTVVLNIDNYRVREIGKKRNQKVIYYGFKEKADVQIIDLQKNEKGQEVKIRYNKKESTHQIHRFGKHHAYAFAVGFAFTKFLNRLPRSS